MRTFIMVLGCSLFVAAIAAVAVGVYRVEVHNATAKSWNRWNMYSRPWLPIELVCLTAGRLVMPPFRKGDSK